MKKLVKKSDIEAFDSSDIGKVKNSYLKRAKIMGILLIMFGLIWIILDIYREINAIYEYVSSILMILFGIYFIIKTNIIKKQEVNKFIHNKKSK